MCGIYAMEHPAEHVGFTVMFEVISAFGTVGYSMGWPGTSVSFSYGMNRLGKSVVMLLMLIGRVRGFPTYLYPPDYYWNTE